MVNARVEKALQGYEQKAEERHDKLLMENIRLKQEIKQMFSEFTQEQKQAQFETASTKEKKTFLQIVFEFFGK
ncbi:hypothetical protein [Bacillus sp. AFS041924]|uniref:hypothetical protein n=1 Tax=Bacillus sp. AFS041924 TaxID=2033503 RepID=UPI001145A1C2|nr:hypothetical protein [Bacillus sp. AFS041924]